MVCEISGTECHYDKELISLIGIIDLVDQVRKVKTFFISKLSLEYF